MCRVHSVKYYTAMRKKKTNDMDESYPPIMLKKQTLKSKQYTISLKKKFSFSFIQKKVKIIYSFRSEGSYYM